jgi:hypothetical protein
MILRHSRDEDCPHSPCSLAIVAIGIDAYRDELFLQSRSSSSTPTDILRRHRHRIRALSGREVVLASTSSSSTIVHRRSLARGMP